MKKIVISRCIYETDMEGYEGRAVTDERLTAIKEKAELIPICPEALGGSRIKGVDAEIKDGRVFSDTGDDITAEYIQGSEKAANYAKENDILCAVLRDTSPMCGSRYVYDGSFTGTLTEGEGFAAERIRKAGIPVITEKQLDEVLKLL